MYYIGVDIGGTFTDCVVVDVRGNQVSAKALSTKADPADGVLNAVAHAANQLGLSPEVLLRQTSRFGHATTIGTNAVLERRGARVGLLATAGHTDALAMMRGTGRVAGLPIDRVYSVHGTRLPEPLTVPGAVRAVHERVDAAGQIVVPLDVEAVVETVRGLIDGHGIDSLAVCLLWSFANPAHEKAIGDRLVAEFPGLFLSLSSTVSPRLGEYERTVATVMNAYVGPACGSYLAGLSARLGRAGLPGAMSVMQSNGGVLPADQAATASLGTIDSGPSGGLTGTASLAAVYGHENVVATDMGGTSFDIGLVVDGRPQIADEKIIDRYTYRLPHLDVRTVACGGGTIARVDTASGALRVGPESAGSDPGPACYGNGGELPTVTDADVVLGLLRPASFLDGRMPLDVEAARRVVGALAERLGLSIEETAAGIVEINNMRAASLVRQQTLERGRDPRDFVLYSYGGAGPLHAFGYAAEIGVRKVLIPLGNGASTLSAFGIASGDLLHYHELEQRLPAPFAHDQLAAAVDQVTTAARRVLTYLGAPGVEVDVSALMRFGEQLMHSLEIPVPLPVDEGSAEALLHDFTGEYARRYGHGATGLFRAAEVFALRARAAAPSPIPPPAVVNREGEGKPADHCEVFWPGIRQRLLTAVHDSSSLTADARIEGPALVELAHTTVAVPPGAVAGVGKYGEITLDLGSERQ